MFRRTLVTFVYAYYAYEVYTNVLCFWSLQRQHAFDNFQILKDWNLFPESSAVLNPLNTLYSCSNFSNFLWVAVFIDKDSSQSTQTLYSHVGLFRRLFSNLIDPELS